MNDRVMEILRELPSRLKSKWVLPSETRETPWTPTTSSTGVQSRIEKSEDYRFSLA
jgi:hypothetical protein